MRHLGQIDGFVTEGTRPQIDLAQARADRATARVQLIAAENAYSLARAALNRAMGVTGSIDYDVADQTVQRTLAQVRSNHAASPPQRQPHRGHRWRVSSCSPRG